MLGKGPTLLLNVGKRKVRKWIAYLEVSSIFNSTARTPCHSIECSYQGI